MKVRPSVKLLCKNCYQTRKKGKVVVRCKISKHKQIQGS